MKRTRRDREVKPRSRSLLDLAGRVLSDVVSVVREIG
jgi:hypothetical protein